MSNKNGVLKIGYDSEEAKKILSPLTAGASAGIAAGRAAGGTPENNPGPLSNLSIESPDWVNKAGSYLQEAFTPTGVVNENKSKSSLDNAGGKPKVKKAWQKKEAVIPDKPMPGMPGHQEEAVNPNTFSAQAESDAKAAGTFLRENSQEAGAELNAGNRQFIEGSDGVQYAGKYGKTDVLASETINEAGEKVTNFSDAANIGTLSGGPAAAAPEDATVVDGKNFNTVFDENSGLDETNRALAEGRDAALKAGDYAAVDRSYMSSAERTADDARKLDEKYRDNAHKADPARTYQTEIAATSARDKSYLATVRQQQSDGRAIRKEHRAKITLGNKVMEQASEYLEKQLVEKDEFGVESMDGYNAAMDILNTISAKNPSLDPHALAQETIRQMNNPEDTGKGNVSASEQAMLNNTFAGH